MSWIKTIPYEEATGKLRQLYERVKGPSNNVDNVLSIHSLRPHTLTAHMGLYKAVLHHHGNSLPKWYLEALGVYVSQLNACSYCVDHHSEGLKKLVEQSEFEKIRNCIDQDTIESHFDGKYLAGMKYAKQITLSIQELQKADMDALQSAGLNDGEILEINQVVSYFNYVNRSVIGLGVNTKGDILGLSPSDNDDPNNWSHE